MQQRLIELREEVLQIERQAHAVLEKLRAVESIKRSMQTATESLSVCLYGWADVESKHINSLNGKPFESSVSILDESSTVGAILTETSKMITMQSNVLDSAADREAVLVITAIEHELSRMESIRELLKVHDEMIHTIEGITSKLAKIEDRKASNNAELKLLLDEKQTCLAAFYKGLLHFTLPICSLMRSLAFKRAFAYLGAELLTSHSKISEESLNFFSALNINYSEIIQEGSHCLDLLSLKPFAVLSSQIPPDTLNPNLVHPSTVFTGIYQQAIQKIRPSGNVDSPNLLKVGKPQANPLIKKSGANPVAGTSSLSAPPVPPTQGDPARGDVFEPVYESDSLPSPKSTSNSKAVVNFDTPAPKTVQLTAESRSILEDLIQGGSTKDESSLSSLQNKSARASIWDD